MSLPKKNSRKITVNNNLYRWAFITDQFNRDTRFWPYRLSHTGILIESAETSKSKIIVTYYDKNLEVSITPKLISDIIHESIKNGWDPLSKGDWKYEKFAEGVEIPSKYEAYSKIPKLSLTSSFKSPYSEPLIIIDWSLKNRVLSLNTKLYTNKKRSFVKFFDVDSFESKQIDKLIGKRIWLSYDTDNLLKEKLYLIINSWGEKEIHIQCKDVNHSWKE